MKIPDDVAILKDRNPIGAILIVKYKYWSMVLNKTINVCIYDDIFMEFVLVKIIFARETSLAGLLF